MARGAAARARARGNGGRRREEIREEGRTGAGEWIGTASGRISPLSRCPGGALELAMAKEEVEGAAVVDLPSARRQRKKTTLPLVGWASSGDG